MKHSPDYINTRLAKSDLFTPRNSFEEINAFIKNWLAQGGSVKGELWSVKIIHSRLALRLYAQRGGIEESLFVQLTFCDSYSGNTTWENSELEILVVPNEDRQSEGNQDYERSRYRVKDKSGDLLIECGDVSVVIMDLDSIE